MNGANVTGSPVSTAPTNAGHYAVVATLTNDNYAGTATGTLVMAKATPTVTAASASFTYSRLGQATTGTATGVGGAALTPVELSYAGVSGTVYAPSSAAPVNAGSYTATALFGGNANYHAASSAPAALTIAPKPAAVVADARGKVYGDQDPLLTGTLTGFVPADNVLATYSRTLGEAAGGVYTIAAALTPAAALGNYNIAYTDAAFTIAPKPLTVTADAQSKVYGEADPALTFQVSGGTLVTGDAFVGNLARGGSENVGTHLITQGTLALSSNYTLAYVPAGLSIGARPLVIRPAANQTKVYGQTSAPLLYSHPALVAGDALSGTLGRANGEEVGTYAYTLGTLTGGPNYLLSLASADAFAITKATPVVTATGGSFTYNAAAHAGSGAVTGISATDLAGALVRLSYAGTPNGAAANSYANAVAPTDAGSYTVTATFDGSANYHAASSAPAALTIGKANQTISVTTASPATATYQASFQVGATASSGLAVAYGSALPLTNAGDTYTMTSGTGTGTVTYGQPGNHNFNPAPPVTADVAARKAAQTISFAALADKTYGDADFALSATASSTLPVSFSVTGAATVDGSTVSITGAGPVTVTASQNGSDNYAAAAPVSQPFTVSQALATIILSNLSHTYNGTAKAATATTAPQLNGANLSGVAVAYFRTVAGVETPVAAAEVVNAGTYTAKATLTNNNYRLAAAQNPTVANLVIDKAAATVTFVPTTLAQTFDGTPKAVQAATAPAGLSGLSIRYDGALTAPTDAGSYNVVATLTNDNFYGTATNTLAIGKATPSITVTVGGPYTYNGLPQGVSSAAVTGVGGVSLGAAAVAYQQNGAPATPVNAGPYAVLASYPGSSNYEPASNNTQLLTVGQAVLTVAANSSSRLYGAGNPVFSATYNGFVGNDDTSAFGGAPALTTAADGTSAVGDYAISAAPGTLSAQNYSFQFTDGVLRVVPRPVTVTAAAQRKEYGDADLPLTYQVTDGTVVNGNRFGGGLTRDPGENVGAYAIRLGSLTLGHNYALSYVGADLTIQPAVLTITADNQSRAYGDANPPLTVSYAGFKGTEDAAVLGGMLAVTTPASPSSAKGSYPIEASGYTSLNYSLNYRNGTLNIGTRAITVAADAQTKVYGLGDPALAYRITAGSLANNDAFLGSLSRAPGETVGSYAIAQHSLALNANYLLSYVGADLTITARPLVVTATGQHKVYDGTTTATVALAHNGLSGDALATSYTTARFDTKNVGTGKMVSVSGIALTGADAGNYSLTATTTTTTATITPLAITGSFTAASKTYDATTAAAVTGRTLNGVVSDDALLVGLDGGTATFATKSVAASKVVTLTGAQLAGPAAPNYTLASVATTTAAIRARPLEITVTGVNKGYDGTTTATVNLADDRVSGDLLTTSYASASFDTKTVASGKAVSVTGIAIAGPDAGNYAPFTTAATTANITPRALLVTATGQHKVYDGTTTATVALTDNRLSGDVFTATYTAATFSDANVGTAKPISVSGIALAGADALNYSANATAAATANITPQYSHPVADTYYTGASFYWTTGTSSNTATLSLVATLKNNTNLGSGNNGDIRTAKVSFYVRNGTSLTPINGAQNLPVGLVSPLDRSTGTASANVQYSINGTTALLDIAVLVGGNYFANDMATDNTINIAVPTPNGLITGCGTLSSSGSSGYIKAAEATDAPANANARNVPAQFGFNVQYSKSLRNPQGAVILTVKSYNDRTGNLDIRNGVPQLHTYRLKSNAISVLATTSPKAEFSGKANISEIVNGVEQSIEGNCTMQLSMVDGAPDQLAATVYRSAGGVWYSSKWVVAKTALAALASGSLSVTGTGTGPLARATEPADPIAAAPNSVRAGSAAPEPQEVRHPAKAASTLLELYPNPMAAQATLHFRTEKGGKAQVYLYNQLGALVATLFNAEVQSGQEYYLTLNRNELAEGVYFCRLISNGRVENRRLTIVR